MTTHVTPHGTAWTSYAATLGEHGDARWMVSDRAATDRRVPTVLYLHGAGHAEDHFEQATVWAPLRQRLMDEGWAVVEGLGGTDEMAPHHWGRPATQLAYRAYLEHVETRLDLGPVVLLGRSMGGIVGCLLYVRDPVLSSRVSGLLLHQAACDLRALADVPAGGNNASGTGQFWPFLWRAWGATDRASFLAASAGHDPMAWGPEVWSGKNLWVGVATGDETVPPDDHGLALRRRWQGRPRLDRLDTRLGGNHTYQGLFGSVDPIMSFLYAATRATPPADEGYRVVSRARWSGSALQVVVDRRRWTG